MTAAGDSANVRLGTRQYLGYAAGDAANNLTFTMTAQFLLVYYTDVVGIGAAAAGTLFLVVRTWDAFADIVAGRMVDRTMTRWGKFRPFFLYGAVPVLLLSVASFSVPALATGGAALVLAYVTYAVYGLSYSLVNIPYGSLAAAMTQDPEERGRLAAFRMIGAAAAILFLVAVVARQVEQFRGDPAGLQQSFLLTTLGLAVLGTALYLVLFGTAKEQVYRAVPHVSLRQSLGTLRANRPLVRLCLASLALLSALYAGQTAQVYYARDVLGNADYTTLLAFLAAAPVVIVAPLVPRLVRTVGKKRSMIGFGVVGIVGGVAIFFAPPEIPAIPFACFSVFGLAVAGINTLMWALEADTVEYGEWRTGVRTEGTTYAMFSFTRKVGQAVGGATAAFAIALGGYVANAPTQPESAIWWITAAIGIIPATFALIGVLLFLGYPLTESRLAEIIADTRARRTDAGASAGAAPPDPTT